MRLLTMLALRPAALARYFFFGSCSMLLWLLFVPLALAQTPKLPELDALYKEHQAMGILFWVIGALVSYSGALSLVIYRLWRRIEQLTDLNQSTLREVLAFQSVLEASNKALERIRERG